MIHHPSSPRAARRAFTLVELLVVIGIIALLMSILMPVLSKAKEQANRAKCASNLHSIGLSITMFAQANAQRVPMAGDSAGAHWGSAYWLQWMNARDYFRLIDSYGATPKLFQCPSILTGNTANNAPVEYWYQNADPAPTEKDLRDKADAYYPEVGSWKPDYAGGPTVQFSYSYWGVSQITPILTTTGGLKRAPYTVYRLDEKYHSIKYNDMQVLNDPTQCTANGNEHTIVEQDDFINPPLMSDATYSEGDPGGGQEKTPYFTQFNHGKEWEEAYINVLRRDGSVQGHVRRTLPRQVGDSNMAAFLFWDYSWARVWWYR